MTLQYMLTLMLGYYQLGTTDSYPIPTLETVFYETYTQNNQTNCFRS